MAKELDPSFARPTARVVEKSISPQNTVLPVGNPNSCLRWRFNRFDTKGPGRLLDLKDSKNKSKNLLTTLLDRLGSLETMTANEIFQPGESIGVIYRVEEIPTPETRRRLTDLEMDDQTELARIQVGNLARLYGVLSPDRTEFFALWWDHSHKVWPSKKWQ